MKLEYNGFDLAQVGKLIILSTGAKGLPEESPNRFERMLRWRVNVHRSTFTENFALCEQGRVAVRRQQGALKWTDEAGKVWVSQGARSLDCNWPENPNAQAGGTFYQAIEGTFVWVDPLTADEASQLTAIYTPSGANPAAVTLASVVKVKVETGIERQGEYISNRDKSVTRVTMAGRFLPNPLAAVADRRAALIAQAAAMRAGVNAAKDGTLNYGTLFANQFVRVDSFMADVDQAQEGVDWSLSCHFTAFPDEAGYAQATFTATTVEDKENGTVTLDLRGAVASDSETRAREKWAAMRASVLNNLKDYACARSNAVPERVDGGDGEAFVRMTFEEAWRKTAGNIFSYALKIMEGTSTTNGLATRVYSGNVTATGVDYATAHATAVAQARALGDNKYQVKLDEHLEDVDRQRLSEGIVEPTPPATEPTGTAKDGIGKVVWVTLEFSFSYRTKGTRLWLELSVATATNSAGEDREEVSGYVCAADAAAMAAAHKEILDLYDGRLMRESEANDRSDQIGEINLSTGEILATKIATATRRDFRFSVFKPKAAGQISMRYAYEVLKNWRRNEKTTIVRGFIWASDANVDDSGAAGGYLTAFLGTLGLSSPVESKRVKTAERAPRHDKTQTFGETIEAINGLEFEEMYVNALSNAAAVMESTVSEEIQCSGDRIIPQPTAESTVTIQRCGKAEGVRSIRGRVVATNETAARDWMKKQILLPLPSGATAKVGGATVTAGERMAPMQRVETVFVDMQTGGVARAGAYGSFGTLSENQIKMVMGEFAITEVYEELTLADFV